MRMSNECQHLTTRYQLGNTYCARCGVWLHAGKNDNDGAGSRPSDLDDRIEFPSGGPCSACGDGDTEQKYHKHVAPAPSGEPLQKQWEDHVQNFLRQYENPLIHGALNLLWMLRPKNDGCAPRYPWHPTEGDLAESSSVDLKHAAQKWCDERAEGR